MKFIKPVIQFLTIALIGVGIIVATSWITNQFKKPDVIEKVVEKNIGVIKPACDGSYDDYQKLVDAKQVIHLINKTGMFASGGKFMNSKDVKVNRSGEGELACGYLHVIAGKDGKSLDEKYDSIYINPQGFGGHVLSKKGAINIVNNSTNKTEFLLPLTSIAYLSKIPFDPNSQNYKTANWVNVLNASNQTDFILGLSTLHQEGYIEDVSIAYRCWDPVSGKEIQTCQLGL